MKHIEILWEGYAKTLPKNLDHYQETLAKLSFLCGAIALYNLMMTWAEDTTVAQKDGEQFLDDLQKESIEILIAITAAIDRAKSEDKEKSCA